MHFGNDLTASFSGRANLSLIPSIASHSRSATTAVSRPNHWVYATSLFFSSFVLSQDSEKNQPGSLCPW